MTDNEIAYLLQNEFSSELFNLLWNRHYKKAKILLKSKLNKFYNVGLEINDFDFIIHKSFIRSIYRYDKSFKINFVQFFITTLKGLSNDYIKKFLTLKHQTINKSSNYDNLKFFIQNKTNLHEQIFNKMIIDKIIYSDRLNEKEKELCKLKVEGYKNKEIEKKMSISRPKLNSLNYQMIKKVKAIFNKS